MPPVEVPKRVPGLEPAGYAPRHLAVIGTAVDPVVVIEWQSEWLLTVVGPSSWHHDFAGTLDGKVVDFTQSRSAWMK